MKNILFITASVGYGGAEKILCFVANNLLKRGYNVRVVNLKNAVGADGYTQKFDKNIEVIDASSSSKKVLRRFAQIKAVSQIAKDFKADVIIGFTSMPNFIAKMVSLRLHIPSIISERGDPFITWSKSLADKVLLYFINRSSGAVFQTEGAGEFYSKGLQKRGRVIPNPIFIKGEVPQVEYKDREKTVVSVGRLYMYQKRYDIMLYAFKLFSENHPEYTLKLYGDGPDLERVKKIINELDLSKSVKLMGLTTKPMQDIAKDGMFLITSDYEGISNALLEAMAAGLPSVSTDHSPGGARLLITSGENGLLAPIGDAKGLADAMCKFAENPDLAEKCGNNAKDVINRFAPKKIIDMWEEYINSLN